MSRPDQGPAGYISFGFSWGSRRHLIKRRPIMCPIAADLNTAPSASLGRSFLKNRDRDENSRTHHNSAQGSTSCVESKIDNPSSSRAGAL